MVLPLEKQTGNNSSLFEQHIDQLALTFLETRYDQHVAEEIIQQKPVKSKVKEKSKEKWQHSSLNYHNQTKHLPLTPLGECCLTRHLENDYRLIRAMVPDSDKVNNGNGFVDKALLAIQPLEEAHPVIGKACLWGSREQQRLCQSDLISMLMRRAKYLDRSRGSCSDVVVLE